MSALLLLRGVARVESADSVPCDFPIMSIVSGNNQTAQPGSYLPEPLVVRILCKNGFVLATPVFFGGTNDFTFSVRTEGPRAPIVQVSPNAEGYASVYVFSTNKAGVTSTISAGAKEGAEWVMARFTATTSASSRSLIKRAGDEQAVTVNSRAPRNFELMVTDGTGRAAADVPVTFRVVSGTGLLSTDPAPDAAASPAVTVRSDFNGRVGSHASWVFFRAGPSCGRASVEASAGGSSVQFTMIMTEKAPLAPPTMLRAKTNSDGSRLFEWDQPYLPIPSDAVIVLLGREAGGEWQTVAVLEPTATSYKASAEEIAPFAEFSTRTQLRTP